MVTWDLKLKMFLSGDRLGKTSFNIKICGTINSFRIELFSKQRQLPYSELPNAKTASVFRISESNNSYRNQICRK